MQLASNTAAFSGSIRATILGSTILAAGLSLPAMAQQTADEPDEYVNTDEHGVDLATGRYYFDVVEGGIGSSNGGISLVRHYGGDGLQDNWSGVLTIGGNTATVNLGKIAETFTLQGGVWVSNKANGGALVNGSQSWTYTASNGTKIVYRTPESLVLGLTDPNMQFGGPGCASGSNCGLPTEVTQPNGVVYSINWEVPSSCWQNGAPYVPIDGFGGGGPYECYAPFRMTSVSSSSSYAMVFEFDSNDGNSSPGFPATAWYNRKSVTFVDTSEEPCPESGCNPTGTQWPKVTYNRPSSNVLEINNSQTGTWRITENGNDLSIKRPGRTSDTLTVTRDAEDRVTSISDDGETKAYSWTTSGGNVVVNMSDASGADGQVITDSATGRPESITNSSGDTISNDYDANGRLTRTNYPEGNYVQYGRDSRGNVTTTTFVPKSGSGETDIVTTASFPSTCSNPLTCNQPTHVVDGEGNRTDFEYSTVHGGVTRIRRPAAAAGQPRPRSDISYTELFAWRRESNGILVQQSESQWLPTLYVTCRVAETCAGSANEQRVAIEYDTPNLLPSSTTVSLGDGSYSATTSFTYDDRDNLITVDGPQAGSVDTVYYFYDASDRRRGVISPDPDGGGSGLRQAVKYTFDSGNRVTRADFGTASGTGPSSLDNMTVLQSVLSTYDGEGNLIQQRVLGGTTTYQVTQYSYDSQNRLQCTAQRMNLISLPSDACSLGTEGAFGKDRITRNIYDSDDRVVQVWRGDLTAEKASAEFTYRANGQLENIVDGKGNRSQYIYDGHDRLGSILYPNKTVPTSYNPSATGIAGSSTPTGTDYEQFSYDKNGNVLSHRNRDGTVINYSYDALDRLTVKDLPFRADLSSVRRRDVYYSYDLIGNLTGARFSSATGQGVTFNYDGLGRLVSEAQVVGSATRTVSSQYDIRGNRTRVTYPDGGFTSFTFDVLNRLDRVRQGNSALGGPVYDPDGRLSKLEWPASASSVNERSYDYDATGRLNQVELNLNGTARDVTWDFTHSPSSQITSEAQSNDAYSWDGHIDVNRNYITNGLNQYTSAGSSNFTYDDNGNLTSDGTNSYLYDIENRLTYVTRPGGWTNLFYDALGRLSRVEDSDTGVTDFVYDGNELVVEYSGSGALLRRYVHGGNPASDDPVIWYEGSAMNSTTRRYVHADPRGSIVAVTDIGGTSIATNSYDEFGIPDTASGDDISTKGRFRYTGQVWIPEIGMYYYKARMYSPTLGRFMQTDPIGYGDGLNVYNYVGSDPVNMTDPTGLVGEGCVNRSGSRIRDCSARAQARETLRQHGYSGSGGQIAAVFDFLGGGSLSGLAQGLGVSGDFSAQGSIVVVGQSSSLFGSQLFDEYGSRPLGRRLWDRLAKGLTTDPCSTVGSSGPTQGYDPERVDGLSLLTAAAAARLKHNGSIEGKGIFSARFLGPELEGLILAAVQSNPFVDNTGATRWVFNAGTEVGYDGINGRYTNYVTVVARLNAEGNLSIGTAFPGCSTDR